MTLNTNNFAHHHEYFCLGLFEASDYTYQPNSYKEEEVIKTLEFEKRSAGPLQWVLRFLRERDFFVVEFSGHSSTMRLGVVRTTSFLDTDEKEVLRFREDFRCAPPNPPDGIIVPNEIWPPHRLMLHCKQMKQLDLLKSNGSFEMRLACVIHTYERMEEDRLAIIPQVEPTKFDDLCDVKLGISTFKVSRQAITTCSPVFDDLFRSSAKSNEQQVVVDDIRPRVAKLMVCHINNGRFPELLSRDLALELLRAANRFQMKTMQSDCEEILMATMDEKNFFHCLVALQSMDTLKLKEFCDQFLTLNYKKVINHIRSDEKLLFELKMRPVLFEIFMKASENGIWRS